MKISNNQKIEDGILAGDTAIIKAFYKKNLPYVRKYICTNDGRMADVEDVFQDSLILIYHKLRNRSLDIHVSINTYFIGICKNKWRDELRRRDKVTYNDQMINNIELDNISVIDVLTKQDQLYIKHASELTATNKTLLELFFEGYSMREIANMMGYTVGYTRKKKFEIKKYLTNMIQSDPVYGELMFDNK